MSFVSSSAALTASGTGAAGLSTISQAGVPASVRDGSADAKKAYAEGLAFEQVLVNELAQQLTATASGSGDDSSDGSGDGAGGDSGDASTGLLGSGSGSTLYSTLVPQALTEGIMSSGGLGVASEIARALDPSFESAS